MKFRFFRVNSKLVNSVFGGWQLNGLTTLQSGTPFSLSMNTDAANTGANGPQRPDVLRRPCGTAAPST